MLFFQTYAGVAHVVARSPKPAAGLGGWLLVASCSAREWRRNLQPRSIPESKQAHIKARMEVTHEREYFNLNTGIKASPNQSSHGSNTRVILDGMPAIPNYIGMRLLSDFGHKLPRVLGQNLFFMVAAFPLVYTIIIIIIAVISITIIIIIAAALHFGFGHTCRSLNARGSRLSNDMG